MGGEKKPEQNEDGGEGHPSYGASHGTPSTSETTPKRPEERTADRVLFHMIAGLIHDVRTPLVAVRGYAKMMLEERAGTLTSTQREYLNIMIENTNRTIPLLKELSELTSVSPLAFEPIGIRDLWQDSIQCWKSRALAKSIQINEKVPSKPPVIRGNRHMLREAFEVLVSRAVKLAEPGGEIVIEFCAGEGEQVEVRISGFNAGVDSELLRGTSNERKPGGPSAQSPWETDAELSLVRDIIQLHGGQISGTSQDRGVSMLILTLPA
jgi:signal transduction histidine kinase